MRTKFILRPYGQNDQIFPGIYHTLDHKVRVLLSDTEFKEMTQFDYETQKPKAKDIQFSRKTNPFKSFEFEQDEKLQTPIDKKIEQLVKLFFAEHPQVNLNDKSTAYTKVPNFNLESEIDKIKLLYSKWDMVRRVVQCIYEMGEKKLEDVAYFYGLNPSGKNSQDITLQLAHFTTGVCVQDNIVNDFLEIWEHDKSKDRDFTVNASKAIKMGIIRNQPKEGRDNFYFGTEFIGGAFNDVLSFLKREERIYKENIVREISEKEQEAKAASLKAQTPPPGFQPLQTTSEIVELNKLKDEAQGLKKEGYIKNNVPFPFFPLDKLRTLVEDAKKLKAEGTEKAPV